MTRWRVALWALLGVFTLGVAAPALAEDDAAAKEAALKAKVEAALKTVMAGAGDLSDEVKAKVEEAVTAFAEADKTVSVELGKKIIAKSKEAVEAEAEQLAAAEAGDAYSPFVVAKYTDDGEPYFIMSAVWILIAGMLVFFMNAGFGMLETGMCRRKNAVHILAKNFIVFGVSSIAFWVLGFGIMFGHSAGYIGTSGFASSFDLPGTYVDEETMVVMPTDPDSDTAPGLSWAPVPHAVKFFFQLVFAGTAATIVSGCVAERIKFSGFMIFTFVLVAIIYPLTGSWVWGHNGWLYGLGFSDFAGSTVVHSVGGWAGLAGILLIGPRLGKYKQDGSVNAIPGHNMSIAALGTLILWLGWFGFNPGSTMAAVGDIGHIAVTTNMAAAFGAVAATVTAWALLGKPDLSMILNGCLAGLVAITAGCASVAVWASCLIGAIGGVLVVLSVLFFDKVKIDDPVGALSVHLTCGIWGTLAVGLLATDGGLLLGGGATLLGAQAIGILAVGATTMALCLATWAVLKYTVGIRVSAAEEIDGLDHGEHGMEAYPGFTVDTTLSAEAAAIEEANATGQPATA